MPAFKISGTFRMGEFWQRFTKEIAAKDENDARDAILSDLGSKHRIRRSLVRVKTIVALKPEEITDEVVRHKTGGGK